MRSQLAIAAFAAWVLTGCGTEKKNLEEAATLFKSELGTISAYGPLVKSAPGKDYAAARITVVAIHQLGAAGASARGTVAHDSKNADAGGLELQIDALKRACDGEKLEYFSDDLEKRRKTCADAVGALESGVSELSARADKAGLTNAFPHLDGSSPEGQALSKQLEPLRTPTELEAAWDQASTSKDVLDGLCAKAKGVQEPGELKTIDDIVASRKYNDSLRCMDLINARIVLLTSRACKTDQDCWRKACVDTKVIPPPGTPAMLIGTMSNFPNGAPQPTTVPASLRTEYSGVHATMKRSCW